MIPVVPEASQACGRVRSSSEDAPLSVVVFPQLGDEVMRWWHHPHCRVADNHLTSAASKVKPCAQPPRATCWHHKLVTP